MGTPARTSILLDIQSTLEGITTANGYNTDVANVEPYIRSRDEIGSGEVPWVGFWMDVEQITHEAFNQIRVNAPVFVVGCIEQADWTTMSATLNLLIDDIIASMLSDPSRGSNAIRTDVVRVQTDEGDPDRYKDGFCVIEFNVAYDRTLGQS